MLSYGFTSIWPCFFAFLCSSNSCEPNTQVDRNHMFTNALFTMCIPILFQCFSYPCVFGIMQAKWALTELLQLQVGVEGNFVWTSSTSPELLHRQKHPPNQTSRLLTVFCRLRSPSLPPAPAATASLSSTQQINLRSTWVHKRGHTLLFLLILCIA